MAEKTYEMLWDCRFCGATKLLGKTHRFCPNCGAAQDPSWRYFPSDAEKVAVEDHVFVGVDKICPACGSLSAGNANNCGNCGSPLNAAKLARSGATEVAAAGVAFQQEDLKARRRAEQEAMVGRGPQAAQTAPQAGRKPNWFLIGLAAIALTVCGGLAFAFFNTTEQNVVVTGHSWEREIRVEEYRAVRDSAWDDSVPSGAYNMTCHREQRSTRRIPDGEDCRTERQDRGDGTFSERQVCETRYREEPVYDDMCDFTIDRWTYTRSATSRGDSINDEPYWEDPNLNDCRSTRLGCEREGGRNERYTLQLAGSNNATYTCDVPFSLWDDSEIEDTFSVRVNMFGMPSCDTIEPTR